MNIEINKIIEILKETITNEYFIYTVIFFSTLIVIKSIKEYKLYKSDCKIFNQKPKPIGYIQNTIVNIIGLAIIINFAFTGYTIFKHGDLINNTLPETKKIIIKEQQRTKIDKNTYDIKNVELITKTKEQTQSKNIYPYKIEHVNNEKKKIIKKQNNISKTKQLKEENERLKIELKKEREEMKLIKAMRDVD